MKRIIVITGAGGGLGRTLAEDFAADGDQLVLLGRGGAKLQAVADATGGTAIVCDVSSAASVESAFAEIASLHPQIDVLINGAAIFQPLILEDASADQIVGSLLTNLAGPILCTRAAIPLLRPGGHIVNVSSESVDLPFPHLTLYQAGKAGLESFSKHIARELEPRGIRVTVVRAGQMMGSDTATLGDAAASARFYQAALARGLDLAARGTTQYSSTVPVFRSVLDSPPDIQLGLVSFQGRPTHGARD